MFKNPRKRERGKRKRERIQIDINRQRGLFLSTDTEERGEKCKSNSFFDTWQISIETKGGDTFFRKKDGYIFVIAILMNVIILKITLCIIKLPFYKLQKKIQKQNSGIWYSINS